MVSAMIREAVAAFDSGTEFNNLAQFLSSGGSVLSALTNQMNTSEFLALVGL